MKKTILITLFLLSGALMAGTTWTQIGDTTYGRDENNATYRATQIGDTTYIHKDPGYGQLRESTACTRVGDSIYCH